MINEAKSNNWKANLETAYEAQSQFMIPDNTKPNFMVRIEKKIQENEANR